LKLTVSKLEWGRKGRPNLRWLDGVLQALKSGELDTVCGINHKKNNWKAVLKAAKACKVLYRRGSRSRRAET
jgi:hypothetical protein